MLERAAPRPATVVVSAAMGSCGPSEAADPPLRDEDVEVSAGPVGLSGHLTLPEAATGVVVFAHGSGSSRHSPRNLFVASVLNRDGFGTLLFDLLTPEEELDRANVFDISLLGHRLVEVTSWLRSEPVVASLGVGYFGASTGAAAALWAAGEPGAAIAAVVSRGGRPDLAGDTCPRYRPDHAHRRWPRRRGAGTQSPGTNAAAVRAPVGGGPRCHPSLRGAWHPRGRRHAGQWLVRRPHDPGAA